MTRYYTSKSNIDEIAKKRQTAFDMIPEGATVIPKPLVGQYNECLIGGIMEDSLRRVYGLCNNGINGYSCSVYWMPTVMEFTEIVALSSDDDGTFLKEEYGKPAKEDVDGRCHYVSDGLSVTNWGDDDIWGENDTLDGCVIKKVIREMNDASILFMEVGDNGWQYVVASGKHLESSGAWFDSMCEALDEYNRC